GVVACGERSGPDQPAPAPLEHAGVETEIEASVPHAANVGRDKIPEVRAGGDGNVEDQVVGILGVPVDRAAVALVTEAEIDAGVVGAGRFAVDVLVAGAGADREGTVGWKPEGCKLRIEDVVIQAPEEGDELVVVVVLGIPHIRGRRNTVVAEQVAAEPRFAQRGILGVRLVYEYPPIRSILP